MLKIKSLSKTYSNGIHALRNISLELEPGIFGLLGPNGAGKSTLMRTIATLQLPDSGQIQLDGLDFIQEPRKARERIGYLPQDFGVYPRVTAREMLDYLAALKGIGPSAARRAEVARQLEKVNLTEAADQRLDTYSGGMKQRFGIAAALQGKPELVIVDEPTAGLDPSERRRFQLLLTEAAKDCILILSSHIVEDIAGLCSNMAIMHKGQLVLEGDPSTLTHELEGQVWEFSTSLEKLPHFQQNLRVLSWLPKQDAIIVHAWTEPGAYQPTPSCVAVEPTLEDLYAFHTR
ncbi:ABC transporter ATP-binding protein [Verrucomicrobiaceae bacterium R5-34]|uniref:ABC transporter ATP-binding protein n=1 Tax=Oceaniferula flava TaxID=2800421 RepID=A0AAE2VD43_9BACT|nr:ABC transporter ATP-binding protein [Oceaniferula flavus]MBK1832002.1 ABC transporter ATP-binding protein [Verrucomicrobiaceae bacterium R5-34]MBK1854099.1 ABC transporter ATP-binding protein [Oceaniferula flavus]MBM1135405.1 ABC transporter ATP-binding protein [Oceaniferula flavus]